ncbi:MAG TPA: sigma-70 family RNA polymerase sigma factor [Pirellulaceae bacterium]|nr:sigma-70 family RNA polymerase sigma factor [Pirellulaceae bacterium]
MLQARGDSPQSHSALAELCSRYWYPVYAFLRRRGSSPEDASDLTQGFFTILLEKEYLDDVDRQKGRFRTFLLTAASRFASKDYEREHAQKRGGGRKLVSLDVSEGECRYQHEPADDWTPEKIFARRWALTILDGALARLRKDHEESGRTSLFEALKTYLTGDSGAPPLAEVARRLSMTEGAVKVAVHRLRERYRQALREEIGQTVAAPADVEDELKALSAALRGEI